MQSMTSQNTPSDEPKTVDAPVHSGETLLSPEVRAAVEQELETICSDPQFRASHRTCAFLRYVTTETLAGRGGEIKERILGKELFGRPISYDTGSDAVVRVRANEVRKRLIVYYESHASRAGWKIHLPLRTYVPVFVPVEPPHIEKPVEAAAPQLTATVTAGNLVSDEPRIAEPVEVSPAPAERGISSASARPSPAQAGFPAMVLPVSHMVIPTLIALFLCAATFRWQIFSGTPYFDFWETLLSGHAGVELVLDADPADARAVTTSDLEMVRPLLVTAEAFHASTQIDSSAAFHPNGNNLLPVHITHLAPQDARDGAGYVTLVPASARSAVGAAQLWIGSTDTRSLDLAIRSISDSSLFPTPLLVAARRRTPTRIRFAEGQPVAAETLGSGEDSWHY